MAKTMAKEFTNENFRTEVLEAPVPVLVDFWTATCGPCRRLAPTIDALSRESQGRFSVGKIDVWSEPELAVQYGISAVPTLLIFRDGQVVNKLIGLHEKPAILKALREAGELSASRR